MNAAFEKVYVAVYESGLSYTVGNERNGDVLIVLKGAVAADGPTDKVLIQHPQRVKAHLGYLRAEVLKTMDMTVGWPTPSLAVLRHQLEALEALEKVGKMLLQFDAMGGMGEDKYPLF